MRISKAKPVSEHETSGEIERVYHEIRQVLRVSGVNLNFRTWAAYGNFLPMMWDRLRANLETKIFEDAADGVRAEAVNLAGQLGRIDARVRLSLGESQSYQIQKALDLYHYINPKLLVLTSAIRSTLMGEKVGGGTEQAAVERVVRGVPANMYPMEMVSDKPDEKLVKETFEDIKRTLSLPSINSDYRTLALWPEYLVAAWNGLKPIVQRKEYQSATDQLRDTSRKLALSLPYPIDLSMNMVRDAGEDEEVLKKTEGFEKLLPGLMINVALLALDWRPEDALSQSPFPAGVTFEKSTARVAADGR